MLSVKQLEEKANTIRKYTIESIGKLGVGHIGGCLSIADILAVLYFDVMNIDPKNPQKKTETDSYCQKVTADQQCILRLL